LASEEEELADDPVETHYTRQDLGGIILAALKRAGKDIDHLTPDDLAPVDEFHGGQRQATIRLADLAGLRGGERVLDIGSGIGGPSRFLASRYGCQVEGIDLTAEFCRVAEMLTQRTGLTGKVGYRQGNALDLPFEEMTFDVVWSQNASMNIADRDRLYAEMHRVLKPGGRLALQEVVAGPGGEPHYPVPWARAASISFLLTAEATAPRSKPPGFASSPGRTPRVHPPDRGPKRSRARRHRSGSICWSDPIGRQSRATRRGITRRTGSGCSTRCSNEQADLLL
jgi:SAM-dependent methyltransferase